jgi:hypothetical protein
VIGIMTRGIYNLPDFEKTLKKQLKNFFQEDHEDLKRFLYDLQANV